MSKIQYYGAFAAALSYIINSANQNRKNEKLNGRTLLYRGLKMTQDEIDAFEPGTSTHLIGYTSTSKQFEVALAFAIEDLKFNQKPVIFEIEFVGQNGLFEMT